MYHHHVELHNVAEVRPVESGPGVRLQRVPESLRIQLNEGAQQTTLSPAGCEIRFVADGPVRVTLASEAQTQVALLHGAYLSHERFTVGGEPMTIEVDTPPNLAKMAPDRAPASAFSPTVRRLMLAGGPLRLIDVEGPGLRPPTSEELPRLRYLAYGTSITHGAYASAPHLTYVAQTARCLGADGLNLGQSGAALCEPEFADWIAGRDDWDVATLALSVNMIGKGFSLEAFRQRVEYMVNAVAAADAARPVLCITIYPYFNDLGDPFIAPDSDRQPEPFRQVLRDVAAASPHGNVHLIEGPDVLVDFDGLSPDLIHPADPGMIQMGENLAAALKPLLGNGS